MKKDGYKITIKAESDCMPKCEQVYYPTRAFESLKEILDYTINRCLNPTNKAWKRVEFVCSRDLKLEFFYTRDPNSEVFVFCGYPRAKDGTEINLRLSVRIENIICCFYCDSVFAKYEYPELRLGFDIRHLNCKECGRNFVFD